MKLDEQRLRLVKLGQEVVKRQLAEQQRKPWRRVVILVECTLGAPFHRGRKGNSGATWTPCLRWSQVARRQLRSRHDRFRRIRFRRARRGSAQAPRGSEGSTAGPRTTWSSRPRSRTTGTAPGWQVDPQESRSTQEGFIVVEMDNDRVFVADSEQIPTAKR